MTHPALISHARRGFSLLELSVVIGIIALIAGVGMNMATGALKAADRVTTQERLNTIKLALDSFMKTYGYLPCPFDRALLPSATAYGVAQHSGTSCAVNAPGLQLASSVAFGGVPVRTLGLPDSYASDAWGNKLSYGVTAALTSEPTRALTRGNAIVLKFGSSGTNYNINFQRMPTTYSNPIDNGSGLVRLDIVSSSGLTAGAGGTILHVRSNNPSTGINGSYNITTILGGPKIDLTGSAYIGGYAGDTGTLEWLEAGTNASYIVVSHGPDGRGAFPTDGTAVPALKKCNTGIASTDLMPPPCTTDANTNCRDIENCQTGGTFDANFYDTTYNDGTNDTVYFDDYVVWGSNALLRSPVSASLYTGATSNCPAGTCEAWCAACVINYPHTAIGGTTTIPPTAALTDTASIRLCKKVITSNATDCKASCFWSGIDATPTHYKCP
jgi:prepilin-type N-terminal cleavage/methylation domain-containing protein